jgi:hypothetical protein
MKPCKYCGCKSALMFCSRWCLVMFKTGRGEQWDANKQAFITHKGA